MSVYKGLTHSHLEMAYKVQFSDAGVEVPYFTAEGSHYRTKLFSESGRPLRWLGEPKPQVLYGLDTLHYGGDVAFLAEGESDSWELRIHFPRTPVLAIPGASSWRQDWTDLLSPFPVLYLSFDNDRAGTQLLDEVWPCLPWARRVKLPEGRDTRDVLQLYGGIEAYEALLHDADYIAACTRYILKGGRV